MFGLRDYQFQAISEMHNGCILCGGVGSGKSRTAIAYYFDMCGGDIYGDDYEPMYDTYECRKDLYIITTARKRDTLEWDDELAPFLLSTNDELNRYDYHHVFIDSWNNIAKYKDVTDAFFIFDEQRVVGYGKWSKTFIRISRRNDWILLSATPGDTWSDYIPVFIANGFYANKSEFEKQHVIWKRFSKFPQIDRYDNVGKLIRFRNMILVDMDFKRQTVRHHNDIWCEFDRERYKVTIKNRWNPYTNLPILNAGELCYVLRRIVNSDPGRIDICRDLAQKHGRVIVFYNYDYELDILLGINWGEDVAVAQWNGHRHELIPDTKKWVYLVQYTAGCEGWNCISTNAVIFFSQTYSYKQLEQACGRIDRLNTPYIDLYYYHLKSKASIDISISRALGSKKKFNERKFGSFMFGE
ncbi:MAG: hypothetical protein J6U54_24220 [Clostridiales bacterium]|nr:hypothetical protein [Clostridiales bacterium]